MSAFEDREKAFEDKYKLDQELQFRVEVRRNKLLGLWVAEQIGLSGADANAYAKEMVQADFEEPGIDDILRKARADLGVRGIEISDHRLETKVEELLIEAKRQVMNE